MSNHDTIEVPFDENVAEYEGECYTVEPSDLVGVVREIVPAYPKRILHGMSWFPKSEVIRNIRAVVSDVIEYVE